MATPMSSQLADLLMILKGVPNTTKVNGNIGTLKPPITEDSQLPENCNCRKSRCLKLYCQCFASKMTCSPSCRCVSCCNIPSMENVRKEAFQLIEQRNPYAFEDKYKQVSIIINSCHIIIFTSSLLIFSSSSPLYSEHS
jgi:hypothetical protein